MNSISAIIDGYKAKMKQAKQFCRIFDTKELVSKQDINSNLKTKVQPEDVKKLAFNALELIKASSRNLDDNQEFMSRKNNFAAKNDKSIHASRE